ncbi:phage tail domain-containing protein [Bacillus cereus]|uniref:phage tail domain-containing protein n=1 Tax=Bacillus cereus TaxID=1396 RepID=UPI00115B5927|nr:phage tail domain-containing protein [Bacillus cereus]TQR48519.1 phage tail family protein [Bacillus cereus]
MSLTIDGKRISELKLALLPGFQHPAAPPIRDHAVSIPGRPGAYYFGSEIEPMQFSLPLLVKPQENRLELSAAIRKMVAAFIDPYGRPKEVKLIYDYEPDKYYWVRYSGSMPIDRYFSMGKFELPLTAYDPHAYASPSAYDPKVKQDYDKGLQYDSGIVYPNTQGFQWLYPLHYSGVFNHSYYVSPFKLIVKGRCKNPKITNLNTGAWVQITETFNDNDQLIIDAKTWTVVKNGTTNLLTKYKGDFIQLTEGENGFMFESETPPSAQVTFDWNHLFL